MKIRILKLLVLGSLCLIATSCELDDSINEINEQAQNTGDVTNNTGNLEIFHGNEVVRSFLGTVIDEAHNPVGGALVKIGDHETRSDSNGVFVFNDVTTRESFAYLKVTARGYITSGRSVRPSEGRNRIEVMLLRDNIVARVNSGQSAQVELPNGATVLLQGAYIKQDGSPHTGKVDVGLHYLDPLDEDVSSMMPGMLYGQRVDGNEAYLETYGMLSVRLLDRSGRELNIDPKFPAILHFPVSPALASFAPDIIPLWSFNEEKGYWIEEGNAKFEGDRYTAEVSHFSFWNCDDPFELVDFCATIVDQNNNPLVGVKVSITSPTVGTPSYGITDSSGQVCGKIPSNQTLELAVLDFCIDQLLSTNIGPFTTSSLNNSFSVDIAEFTQLIGTVVNCNNEPIQDGYVKLENMHGFVVKDLNNGMIDIPMQQCANETTVQIEVIDTATFLSTSTVSVPITSPATNAGTLVACDAVMEFITYTVSGPSENWSQYDYFNIFANKQSDDNSFLIQTGGITELYLSSNAINIGTYSFGPYINATADMQMGIQHLFLGNGPNTVTFELTKFGEVGDYIDITFSGEYTNHLGELNTLTGVAHVIRDN